jgi:hypothetical protein
MTLLCGRTRCAHSVVRVMGQGIGYSFHIVSRGRSSLLI